MHSVERIAAEIVRREGGFVNDPDDPGGATNHGVTIHTMRQLRLDLDGNGRIDTADVKAAATEAGFAFAERRAMPANNLMLLFRRD